MTVSEWAIPLASILLGGSFIGGIVLLLKVRPEAGSIAVVASEKVVLLQTGTIDRLEEELEELRKLPGQMMEMQIAFGELQRQFDEVHREKEALAQNSKMVEQENTHLKERVKHLENQVAKLEAARDADREAASAVTQSLIRIEQAGTDTEARDALVAGKLSETVARADAQPKDGNYGAAADAAVRSPESESPS